MRSQLVDCLTEEILRELADGGSFSRGQTYYRQGRVRSLEQDGDHISATVEGTEIYDVELWVEDDELCGECDCPVGMDGWFCKHCVAVGLTWLNTPVQSKTGTQKSGNGTKEIQRYLEQQEKATLVQLILDRVAKDREWQETLALKAATTNPKGIDIKPFEKALKDAIATRGYIEYGEARTYAKKIQKVVDSLEELVNLGKAQAVMELCETAVSMLQKVSIDDSNGYLGETLANIQALHLAACRIAKPTPTVLAERLFDLEMQDQYETFYHASETYGELLGKKGNEHYRELVKLTWQKLPELKPSDHRSYTTDTRRWRLTNMMESIARQTGDVDALVAIKAKDLSQPYHYLTIAELYRDAGKIDQAIQWAEDGLKAFSQYADRRLREFLIAQYQKQKRFENAIAIAWQMFTEAPRVDTYQTLKQAAEAGKQWQQKREEALDHIRQRMEKAHQTTQRIYGGFPNYMDRSLLVEIFLWEGEVEQAWLEAKTHGCSEGLWLRLAEKRQKDHPEDALSVYMQRIEPLIQQTNNSAYAEAVKLIKKVKDLMLRLKLEPQLAQYLAHLQKTYKSKRNFIKLLSDNKLT
jgi:uncharacterized Zn finger protein